MDDKKFSLRWLINKAYNKNNKADEAIITFEIETANKMPEEFYVELTTLVHKYCS